MTKGEEKRTLRRTMEKMEARLSPAYRARSDRAIARHLLAMPEYQAAEAVCCFAPMGREIDTRPILEDALKAEKRLFLFQSVSSGGLTLRRVADPSQLAPAEQEGTETACPPELMDEIDFAILPCLTCNYAGQRLGRGKAGYDRFLRLYRGGTVLLCREALIRQEIPVEPHDMPVPWVLTERGLYEDGVPAPLG